MLLGMPICTSVYCKKKMSTNVWCVQKLNLDIQKIPNAANVKRCSPGTYNPQAWRRWCPPTGSRCHACKCPSTPLWCPAHQSWRIRISFQSLVKTCTAETLIQPCPHVWFMSAINMNQAGLCNGTFVQTLSFYTECTRKLDIMWGITLGGVLL